MRKPTWKAVAPELAARVDKVLDSWLGTPYMVGQQAKGAGVDCVRFVAGVLDELTGRRTPIETLPQDAALHARTSAILAMKKIIRAFEPNEIVWSYDVAGPPAELEPGDVLVTAMDGAGPGHAMIAGGRRGALWESTANGVRYTGLSGLSVGQWRLRHVYRLGDKAGWVR